jgi:hypothetical protein
MCIAEDYSAVISSFEQLVASGGMDYSCASAAVSASAAMCSAATSDASRLHWLQYTRRCLGPIHHVGFFSVCDSKTRVFDIVYDMGCRLNTSAMSFVFEACSRLDSPLAELDIVYKRHLTMCPVDEKLFLHYLRFRLSITPTKVPNALEEIILDMAHASPPILPFIKLFNVAISSCQLAHEAVQVLHLFSRSSVVA